VEKANKPDKTTRSNLFPNLIIASLIIILMFAGYKLFSDIKPLLSGNDSYENKVLAKDLIQVEVLNGCGKNGIADKFTELLRKNKFDVVNTGNYKSYDVNYSIVIDRTGNLENATRLADLLNIDRKNVIQQINKNSFLDVTLIVGKDYTFYTSN
jgi:LytR cell envelope-related transcriptional attenuator